MTAPALAQFVTTVENASLTNNTEFAALGQYVKKAVGEVLVKQASSLDNILILFDLNEHSIGILAILYAKLQAEVPDFVPLFVQLQEFINGLNERHIRQVADLFCDFCHCLTDFLVEKHKEPSCGIALLLKAIEKLRTSESQLTPIHSDLCQLCLCAKNVKPALAILDVDITEILKENLSTGFDPRLFLQYYYYGGIIYCSVKNFERAAFFFEVAITTPCSAISQIVVQSYKKFVLVGLIMHGKVPSLPKYTSNLIGRFVKQICHVYEDLAKVYGSNVPDKVREFIQKHADQFQKDKNMGLVKQVLKSLYKRNIQRLTKTFLTLSLVDLAHRCHLSGPQEAEQYIVSMIETGEIFASVNQKDGMVYFHDNPEKYCTWNVQQLIDHEISQCVKLDELLQNIDTQMMLNPQYVQKMSKSSALHDDEGLGLSVAIPSSSSRDYVMQVDSL